MIQIQLIWDQLTPEQRAIELAARDQEDEIRRRILESKIGSREGPFGEALPDPCLRRDPGGYGTYSPRQGECMTCPVGPACVARTYLLEPQNLAPSVPRGQRFRLDVCPWLGQKARGVWISLRNHVLKSRTRNPREYSEAPGQRSQILRSLATGEDPGIGGVSLRPVWAAMFCPEIELGDTGGIVFSGSRLKKLIRGLEKGLDPGEIFAKK